MSLFDLLLIAFPELRLPFVDWSADIFFFCLLLSLLFIFFLLSFYFRSFNQWLLLPLSWFLFFHFNFTLSLLIFTLSNWSLLCWSFTLKNLFDCLFGRFITFLYYESDQLQKENFQLSWECLRVIWIHLDNCCQIAVNTFISSIVCHFFSEFIKEIICNICWEF